MFYTIGQRSKWQRVLYIILPILSIALVILAYAMVQQKMPLLLPDGKGLWERFLRTFTNPVKNVNLIGHIAASLRRVLIALLFAWTLGIGFGVLIGWNRTCSAAFLSCSARFPRLPGFRSSLCGSASASSRRC
mgnify:CR=1 FL=1